MSPLAMGLALAGLLGIFGLSARRRWALLRAGAPTWERRDGDWLERLKLTWTYAFAQKKLRYYRAAGVAHQLIFVGFVVLLARTLILVGRGFDPAFNLWVLGPETLLGSAYAFAKDMSALVVLVGVSVFGYYRLIRPQKRMTQSLEALAILGIIAVMMLADLLYDGASLVLHARYDAFCGAGASGGTLPLSCEAAFAVKAPLAHLPLDGTLGYHFYPEPLASLFATLLASAELSTLVVLSQAGFWTHTLLVFVFLNLLPYSKHFHVLTAIPNVFLGDLSPRGRLTPLAASTEALMEKVEEASELDDPNAARIGYARIEHFSWKDNLDFFSCTECGRCTDHCPAAQTGKELSPKQLILDLRGKLYAGVAASGGAEGVAASADIAGASEDGASADLVPAVIAPEVLWACTTCGACVEQCPVNIEHVDKIVQMRRQLVTMQGEFPPELGKPFEGIETNGNPWNLSRLDRAAWCEGLEIATAAERPDAPVLFWVGCAPSYDDRAKKTARATARLLQKAGVDFVILGEEESCTGDAARRAGNEYLFGVMAEQNIEVLDGYKAQGGVQKIVTTCPHCFNTLKNEYPDLGGQYEVVHHTDYLLELIKAGKLSPDAKTARGQRVAYHDACYLGRYNAIYDAPRRLLEAAGAEVIEVEDACREKSLCCGAGGGQMFMEEQNDQRVNVKRSLQLVETGAETLATACPFCLTMVSDGLKAQEKDEAIAAVDVVELLADACE